MAHKATRVRCMDWELRQGAETTQQQWRPARGGDLWQVAREQKHRAQRNADRGLGSTRRDVEDRSLIEQQFLLLDVEPSRTQTGGGVQINVYGGNVQSVGVVALGLDLGLCIYSGAAVIPRALDIQKCRTTCFKSTVETNY